MSQEPSSQGDQQRGQDVPQMQQRQQLSQQAMPTAHYPPMMSSRYPSAQVSNMRSSLTASRHYTTSTTSTAATPPSSVSFAAHHHSTGDLKVGQKSGSTDPAIHRAQTSGAVLTTSTDPSSSGARKGGATATASSATRHYPSQIRFCQANMVACINCQPPTVVVDGWAGKPAGSGGGANIDVSAEIFMAPTPPRVNRKLGPILLDLRQLITVPFYHSSNFNFNITNDDNNNNNNMIATTSLPLFTTRTVALSRGNPSLGTSVSSTCLDVSSILPASTYGASASGSAHRPPPCATGLTTGALCIHTFTEKSGSDDTMMMDPSQSNSFSTAVEYFHTPRHHRQATAVSWRRHNSRHVAIGLVSSAMAGVASPIGAGGHHHMNMNAMNTMNMNLNMNARVRGVTPTNPAVSANRGAGGGGSGGGGDRDFCCFLWDIEHQAGTSSAASSTTGASSTGNAKRTNTSPLFKLSHNSGVASLAWLLEGGQTLAVGGQQRNIQLYDLRVSGTSSATPPISAFGHNFGVHGIEVDPFRPYQFATFCRAAGEPVKVWDARRMDSVVSEIKSGMMLPSTSTSSSSDANAVVSSLRWSSRETGILSVAIGDVVLDYDTSSRPVLSRVNRAKGTILDMALFPGTFPADPGVNLETAKRTKPMPATASRTFSDDQLISELYPQRMLVVLADRTVQDMAKHTIAPLAVSRRDGRVAHALGKDLFLESTRSGPSAMESLQIRPDEDISATMMRRARCLHTARYSMDTASNIQVLAEEMPLNRLSPERDSLLRLWTWIDRMEALCSGGGNTNPEDLSALEEGGMFWASKGFGETGVWKLLALDHDNHGYSDEIVRSDSLACDIYDSPERRAALTACGWTGRFDLSNVLAECESLGEYERSAALAVFHGSLGSAVDALQRGADVIHRHLADKTSQSLPATAPQYAETLQLIAMCIAGFGGAESQSPSSSVWRRACESLLRRPDLNGQNLRTSRTAYLRALCTFLVNISTGRSYDEVLDDHYLSLCDRVAFACRFLARDQLKRYLQHSVHFCQKIGNIEGLVITGIEKEGIKIIQSYVDLTADVQTAALVTSRVILPSDWTSERRVCAEFLDAYRTLLNTWQMWQSRAMFDVDRAELLRRIKIRQADAQVTTTKAMNFQARRMQSRGRQGSQRPPDPDIVTSVPAQLDARCNYCSSSLCLKRLDSHANQWLSKMKPVLSCCPSCQKPLPRCAICLLSLGCLNPYMELTRERERVRPSRGGTTLQAPDDLSSLANLPFAEWFTWCMTCKHGGHAHHLVGWFANHEVCPVSGCDCRCQFDGIQKLSRPALQKPPLILSAESIQAPADAAYIKQL